MTTKTQAQTATPATGTVYTEEVTPQEILDFLQGVHVDENVSIEEFQRSFLTQLQMVDTAEEIFGERKPVMSENYLDQPFTITGVKWLKSRFGAEDTPERSNLSFWALLNAVDANKNSLLVGTSSFNAMAKIWQASKARKLSDIQVKFVKSDRDTAAGYRFIKLVPAS